MTIRDHAAPPAARPKPARRAGRLRVAGFLAVGGLAVAVAAAGLSPAEAAQRPLRPDADPGATFVAGRGALSPSATSVTGVVTRLGVDEGADHPSHADGALLTYVVSPAGTVQVPTPDLEHVATGSQVSLRLGARVAARGARPSQQATSGRRVTSVDVLAAVPAPSPAPATSPALAQVSTGATTTTVAAGRTTTAAVAAAAAPHSVTTVLAVPKGGVQDGQTPSGFSAWLTGTAAPFWAGESEGAVTFSLASAKSWVTSSYDCSAGNAQSFFKDVAAKAGFTAGTGKHLAIYLPPGSTYVVPGTSTRAACPAGLGTIGSGPTSGGSLYVNGTQRSLLTHELGHNLSLGHSNELKCPTVSDGVWSTSSRTFGSSCAVLGYYDLYDVMGFSWERTGSLSTLHAQRLGFLGTGRLQTTSTSRRVLLKPVSGHTGLVSLRVADPAGATYVVEYRPGAGRDAWLATSNEFGVKPGVVVRRVDPASTSAGLLLDATPTSSSYDYVVPLLAGKVFTSASRRVTVTVEALTSIDATVAVRIDGAAPAAVAGAATTTTLVIPQAVASSLRTRAATTVRAPGRVHRG